MFVSPTKTRLNIFSEAVAGYHKMNIQAVFVLKLKQKLTRCWAVLDLTVCNENTTAC